jgi:hypothetical protein
LETLSEIFNGNVKDRQRFSMNLCNVNRMPPFQILIHPWEPKNVARREVRRVGCLGHNHHFVFSQKGGVLLTLQGFKENRWRSLTEFSLKILNNVSGSGSGVGIIASSHTGGGGANLKGTKVSNLNEYFKYFF